jgi:hypothetical protein
LISDVLNSLEKERSGQLGLRYSYVLVTSYWDGWIR